MYDRALTNFVRKFREFNIIIVSCPVLKIKLSKTSSGLNKTCRAENAAGMSTHSAKLTVNGVFTGRTEILYLQRSLRLFLLTLVESL